MEVGKSNKREKKKTKIKRKKKVLNNSKMSRVPYIFSEIFKCLESSQLFW